MASRTGYKQLYSSNRINASSAGRSGQTRMGRFRGAAQGFSEKSGGSVSQNGRMLSRRQRDYQVRKGIRNWELEHGRKFGTEPGTGTGGGSAFKALATG